MRSSDPRHHLRKKQKSLGQNRKEASFFRHAKCLCCIEISVRIPFPPLFDFVVLFFSFLTPFQTTRFACRLASAESLDPLEQGRDDMRSLRTVLRGKSLVNLAQESCGPLVGPVSPHTQTLSAPKAALALRDGMTGKSDERKPHVHKVPSSISRHYRSRALNGRDTTGNPVMAAEGPRPAFCPPVLSSFLRRAAYGSRQLVGLRWPSKY